MPFAERIGAALLRPSEAFAASEADRGRAAADAFVLLGLKLLCLELPALVAGLWALLLIGPGLGLSHLLGALDQAWRVDVLLIFGATLVIVIGAGKRRDWARDFDLAAVAWLPALVVVVLASIASLFVGPNLWLRRGASIAAVAWVAFLCIPAIRVARRRT
jgi:hypothetical protein